jgi:hypothetical protein
LARAGLNRLAPLTPPAAVTRYEMAASGRLGASRCQTARAHVGVGHRIHGNRRARAHGTGWEYAHVAIDDHSWAAYVEVLPDQPAPPRRRFCSARSLGLPAVAHQARLE